MDTIGKYKIVRVIGEGGMGKVYEAIDPMIGRRVAIKTISLTVETDAEARARFFREAQAAGQLSHPNLITIHDIGDADGTPYIVMEFLEGADLNRKIRRDFLSYDAKMQIMIDVCEGLAFAHAHEIVHRDIKPANIFITTNGRAKILDFGLARGALSDVTQTGKIVGTPNYMSPEQIRDDGVDHRSDIFAAGVVFYELLCGRKAFDGESVATTLYKVLETQPQPVHLVDGQLPVALSGVIERALAKDRLARFQTSSEMLDAVLHAHGRTSRLERANLQTMPMATPARGTAAPVQRKWPTIAAWAAAGVAVAGIAGFMLVNRPTPAARSSAAIAQPDASPSAEVPPPTPRNEASPSAAPARPETPSVPDNTRVAKAAIPRSPAAAGTTAGVGPLRSVVPSPVAPSPAVPSPVVPSPGVPSPVVPSSVVSPAETKVVPAAPAPPPAPLPAPEARTTPVVVPPVTAPVIATPPPPTTAPPPVRAEDNAVAAVQAVLARYRAALESRDISALKRIWPALSGRQEDAIRNEFDHSRAIAVGLEGVDIRPTSSGATVTCRRSYAVTTAGGQTLSTATTMVMTLTRREGGWSIEAIRHEVAR